MSKLKQGGTLYIVVGAVLAVVAAGMFYVYASRAQRAPATAAPPPTVAQTKSEVLVAATEVPAYSIVTPEMLKKELVDKDKVKADDAFEDSQVLGKMTSASLQAGQRVSLSQLTSASFSYTVPEGKRGLALNVDELSTLSGLIEDGDFVDVLYSGADETAAQPSQNGAPSGSGAQAKFTKTVLEDVQVLKVIRTVQPSAAKDGQAATQAEEQQTQQTAPVAMVIVAVTNQQAEVVKFTREDGSLHLVLRAKNDHAIEETTGVTDQVLKDKYGVPAP